MFSTQKFTNIYFDIVIGVTNIAKIFLTPSYPGTTTNFEFSCFRICLNFFTQSRILSITGFLLTEPGQLLLY